jgi:hypothetical protein
MVALNEFYALSEPTAQIGNRMVAGSIVDYENLCLDVGSCPLHAVDALLDIVANVIVDDDDT